MRIPSLFPLLAVALMMPALDAQQPTTAPQPPEQVERPRSQVPTLGRPTKATDPQPLLDFDTYFAGKWTFTWDFPESPLGPAGTLTGTTVYKPLDGKFYEATTEATTEGSSPSAAITITEIIGYQKDNRVLSRSVTDSRGFSYMQVGTIGGDLGGYYTIFYESAPFVHKGQSIRLKSAMRLLSPLNYKVQTTMSVDGGPFTNYGNPWWQKAASATAK